MLKTKWSKSGTESRHLFRRLPSRDRRTIPLSAASSLGACGISSSCSWRRTADGKYTGATVSLVKNAFSGCMTDDKWASVNGGNNGSIKSETFSPPLPTFHFQKEFLFTCRMTNRERGLSSHGVKKFISRTTESERNEK